MSPTLSVASAPLSSAVALLERADFTSDKLARAVTDAEATLAVFRVAARASTERGLQGFKPSPAEQKFIRQSGGIPAAVVQKLGSNSIAKRKPEDRAPFLAYVQAQHEAGAPLLLRLGAGPVKNVHHYGAAQQPDLAEYLMFSQLARVAAAVATIYPHGVKVQMVPDDKRGAEANQWPASYGERYIGGLQQMVKQMGFADWVKIENGQTRLYEEYKVASFRPAAEEHFRNWEKTDPVAYGEKIARASAKARDNMAGGGAEAPAATVEAAALRYLVALKAEEMSGIFAPRDVFPLRYANHPGSYQLFTMGAGQTKLPWQIALPHALLPERDAADAKLALIVEFGPHRPLFHPAAPRTFAAQQVVA